MNELSNQSAFKLLDILVRDSLINKLKGKATADDLALIERATREFSELLEHNLRDIAFGLLEKEANGNLGKHDVVLLESLRRDHGDVVAYVAGSIKESDTYMQSPGGKAWLEESLRKLLART